MQEENSGIDFVMIWVDGNDPQWRAEKNRYSPDEAKFNVNDVRYRDWDLLHYWFRGVEKFAPWVRKIHFVTCGHVPKWLNMEHPKLHFVKHSDYIDADYLPTFSANPIELNLHRIEGLSERFVFFNDDMFLTAPVKEKDYFVNGLPRDVAVLNPPTPNRYGIPTIILNDLGIIADHFDFITQFKANWKKWINPIYGVQNLRTLLLLPWRRYLGFYDLHLPSAFLKSTFEEVWRKEQDLLRKISCHRFRDDADVNQYLMIYWQIAKGEFVPGSPKNGRMFEISFENIDRITDVIRNQRMKMICINDSEKIDDFHILRQKLVDAFDCILKEKSSFEK
ncbi:MAG: Stealth CR1 domain-containing protein [Faecousia sp.]